MPRTWPCDRRPGSRLALGVSCGIGLRRQRRVQDDGVQAPSVRARRNGPASGGHHLFKYLRASLQRYAHPPSHYFGGESGQEALVYSQGLKSGKHPHA